MWLWYAASRLAMKAVALLRPLENKAEVSVLRVVLALEVGRSMLDSIILGSL